MSDIIHRTTLEQRFSVHEPDFSSATWIIDPDLSALGGVPKRYWKIVVDDVLEMTAPEKVIADQAIADAQTQAEEEAIKSRLSGIAPLDGFSPTVDVTGLTITIDVPTVIVGDVTVVVADGSDTKFVQANMIYNSVSDVFSILVLERTDGLYADLTADEILVAILGEWSVVASGTVLVPV